MANYNFNKDIADGERGEQVVREDLELAGASYIGDNKNNQYDIIMTMPNGKDVKFEIKTDVWCIPGKIIEMPFGNITIPSRDNGNMFIEFECRGKDSGIRVSKAEWFVTYFPHYGVMWYIMMDKLITLCESENIPTSEQAGDEDSNTKGYLLPRNEYKEHFKIRKTEYKWES